MKVQKLAIFAIIIAAFVIGVVLFLAFQNKTPKETQTIVTTPVSNMKLTSPAFGHNQLIPLQYTCDGEDINPPLIISEVPQNAKSLVLIMDDPDAPGRIWVHWTVWNIEPTTTAIPEGSVPQGAQQGLTDFGKTGYGGPCPPSETHRYFFKLYALDTVLQLSSDAKKVDIESVMEGHIIDRTELIGLYSRQR